MCEVYVFQFQRQGKEGGWQEGVATKIHGHDPTIPILHEIAKVQVRDAETQAVFSELGAEVNAATPPCDGEDL